ncbi:GNAT family N-acetyltransferase [Streptococcus hyovaginalis]|uniref:GNAT family N-acetyltransferase n=1 Tax=Streptococcus hyovaginalis TaxID=149015 RepID=UPI002A7F1C66|nr:GNAT family N-acetyltransferase [Streptococcus hyovaginalis]MDY4510882.1 GNAT family N-acetyltransferase [Streptococcus hyovaginalis]MDY5974306.1 GNAT family N-acetyltransferase [Streptococcus hyovaginalis]
MREEEFVKRVFDEQFEETFGRDAMSKLVTKEYLLTKEEGGNLLAVLQAIQSIETVHIKNLVVAKAAQGKGLGSQLLLELEEAARQNGVTSITLSTKSYQAKEFYLKNGYQIYASLENVPMQGVTKYQFIKYL